MGRPALTGQVAVVVDPLAQTLVHARAALVTYLRDDRPKATWHRAVFLTVDAPHASIRSSTVVSMVSHAMRRAGLAGGSHRLRHTAAMRVIAEGGGLVEAGQLLRHSSMTATGIYARADVAALAELARPWPGDRR